MKKGTEKKTPPNLAHLPEGRLKEIQEGYAALGLIYGVQYPGADQLSKQLQRLGTLKFDQVQFTTSSNTLSPFKMR
jgi:hypothetical protein